MKFDGLCSVTDIFPCLTQIFGGSIIIICLQVGQPDVVQKFAVLPQARDFLIAKLDYDVLIKKYQDVNKIIKDLVGGAMWDQLGFVVALIDKLGDQLILEKHYTKVMQQPLKSLKDKANEDQFKIVEPLCKFFNVNLALMEDAVDAEDGKAS